MPSTTNNFPTNFVEVDNYGQYWLDPVNIFANDGAFATNALSDADTTTNTLAGLAFNFAVPTNQLITGVQITLSGDSDHFFDGVDTVDTVLTQLFYQGAPYGATTGAPHTDIIIGPGTTGLAAISGSSTDLWGALLTPAIVNDPTFGIGFFIAIGAADSYPVTFRIDYIKMQIFYQTSGVGNRSSLLGVW